MSVARDTLLLLSSIPAARGPHGGLVVTQKYQRGAAEYARHWPGPVLSLFPRAARPIAEHDAVEVRPAAPGPAVAWRPRSAALLRAYLARAALVVAPLAGEELATAELCRALGIPLIFICEYTLATELQIAAAEVSQPLRLARRAAWLYGNHRRRLAALALADGLQCSGTPTFDAYRELAREPLLFFDNRVPEAQVITPDQLADKQRALQAGAPLRLVFGGRLTAMKGVLDLPLVAAELRRRQVAFTLDIVGNGPLRDRLERELARLELRDRVRVHGAMDFVTGWVPLLRARADLFVCCHPQGDPSSTYPEVMSCGVPIAGYANEAFTGIVAHSQGGWLTPVGSPRALAEQIAHLDRTRGEVAAAAARARTFAVAHAFERTFFARTAHMLRIGGRR